MRFATIAAFAGAAVAQSGISSTVWSTEYHTVTACPSTVTDCPASSTKVLTTSYPLTTSTVYTTTVKTVTSCAPTVTNCPAHSTVVVTETKPLYTTVCPVTPTATPTKYGNSTLPGSPPGTKPPGPVGTGYLTTSKSAAACPTYSVKTISTSVTTVIPTVIYETVAIPCPTTAYPSSGFPAPSSNGTATKPPVATVTAGAATMGNSLFVVAAAGLAAVVFA